MRTRTVPLAILLFGVAGLACSDHRDILGSGSELTSTPCNSCPSGTFPHLDCPTGRSPHCLQRTDGTCGWQNACSEPTTPVTVTCGGLAGATCARGQYCKLTADALCGAADQTGTCTAIPDSCTLEYAPVCGCDGNTYATACAAAAKSVSVAKTGACAPSSGSKTCGGIAGLACAPGEYCNLPVEAHCGAADQTGTCSPIPEVCTDEYGPVCGCDGNTYPTACAAAAKSVSVAKTGACAPNSSSKTCGGIAGLTCAQGEYCNLPVEAHCGAADQTGICTAIPDVCTDEYAPVCGCDGKTYATACTAAAAGVSVNGQGACR